MTTKRLRNIPLSEKDLAEFEGLCNQSIKAGIKRLCDVGVWPRPPASRKLRPSYDFNRKELEDIPTINNVVDYLSSLEPIKSLYPIPSWEDRWTLRDTLYEFWQLLLVRILRDMKGDTLNTKVFKKWFDRFMHELFSDIAVLRTIDTVVGLDLPDGALKLDRATILMPIHSHQWREVTQNQHADLDDDNVGPRLPTTVVISTIKHQKASAAFLYHEPEMESSGSLRFLALLNAIRLSCVGIVRPSRTILLHLSRFPLRDPFSHEYRASIPRVFPWEKTAILPQASFQQVKLLWLSQMQDLVKAPSAGVPGSYPLAEAHARFFATYDKPRFWLDNILDLTIALESLFSPSDDRELRHRVAMRAGWLLDAGSGKSNVSKYSRNRIYECVKTMYDIRNRRVHAAKPIQNKDQRRWIRTLTGAEDNDNSKGSDVYLAVEEARAIVRQAIAACTRLYKLGPKGPTWPFPDDFDQNIIIAGQRKKWQKAAGILAPKA